MFHIHKWLATCLGHHHGCNTSNDHKKSFLLVARRRKRNEKTLKNTTSKKNKKQFGVQNATQIIFVDDVLFSVAISHSNAQPVVLCFPYDACLLKNIAQVSSPVLNPFLHIYTPMWRTKSTTELNTESTIQGFHKCLTGHTFAETEGIKHYCSWLINKTRAQKPTGAVLGKLQKKKFQTLAQFKLFRNFPV